jgi:hypothetical protein
MPRRLVWLLMGVLLPYALAAAGLANYVLADPVEMLRSAKRVDFVGTNAFAVEMTAAGAVLRTTPHRSACGLYQRVDVDGRQLQHIRWTWRVDRLHRTADIRDLRKEDFGAKVMFIFGEPSIFNRDVPTLAYVWTSTPVVNGTVLPSQRYTSLAYIQLHGRDEIGRWQQEERNVTEDFKAVFGREPGRLRYIAIFNDNDQTGEAASALLGPILDAQ